MSQNKIKNSSSRGLKTPWLVVATSVLGVTTVVFASLFAWKLLNPSEEGDTPDTDLVTVTFDAGKGNVVEGTNKRIVEKTFNKGVIFRKVFDDLNCAGGFKKGEDFKYWELNGEKIYNDYIINNNIHLTATYKPIKDGQFLTITSRADNCSVFFNSVSADELIKISADGETWQTIEGDVVQTIKYAGDSVYLKRDKEGTYNSWSSLYYVDAPYSISGPIESLIGNRHDLAANEFMDCFKDDEYLASAVNLNLSKVYMNGTSTSCYQNMFSQCKSLVVGPELPAQTLAKSCYEYMFNGCVSLTQAPELKAKDLSTRCYKFMFQECTSLVNAPRLPAMTLAEECYGSMFYKCHLTKAPDLPAPILAKACYEHMFFGCKYLVVPPKISAEVLGEYSCVSMFSGCMSLVTPPELNAMTLANNCYQNMFQDCTSLISAPTLPATILKTYCYRYMFSNCTSLITPTTLPAEELVESCYESMFKDCSSLKVRKGGEGYLMFKCPTTQPSLYSTSYMFSGTGGDFTGNPETDDIINYYY